MSTYPGPDDSQRFGAEPQRTGMGSGTKWLLGLGIGCGVVVLLCCGGGIAFVYFGAKSIESAATKDPAKVTQIADSITSIDIPAGLRPTMGIDYVAPIINKRIFTAAIFEDSAGEGTLTLAEFPIKLEDADRENLEMQMNQQMAGQGEGHKNIIVRESRSLELTVRGKPAKFMIQKGELSDASHDRAVKPAEKAGDRKEVVSASGTFQGKNGAALIVIQLDADKHSEEDVEKVLRSIK